jgi:hypothetical protein
MELVQVCHHKYQEYNDDPTKNLKLQLLNFNYHRRAALMPSIAVVRGTTIAIYYNDHDPPHFHAIRGGVEFARLRAPSAAGPVAAPPAI